jgi:hypothetical protein
MVGGKAGVCCGKQTTATSQHNTAQHVRCQQSREELAPAIRGLQGKLAVGEARVGLVCCCAPFSLLPHFGPGGERTIRRRLPCAHGVAKIKRLDTSGRFGWRVVRAGPEKRRTRRALPP